MEQRTFETAVASSASIVKPTVPKNVLAEFEHFAATGSRFKKNNPFEEENENQTYARQQAPPPPPPQPVVQFVAPPPQPPRQQGPPPTLDYKDFANFSINNNNSTVIQQQQNGGNNDPEKIRLVNAMQQHLRLKAAHGQAMTVGELSAEVRELTGQSWGGYWEGKYGNLLSFLKSNSESFSVVRSKYVVCRGHEDIAMRQLEKDAQEQSQMLEEKQRMQTTYSSVPMNQLQQHQSFYAPTFDMNPFGGGPSQQQQSYYGGANTTGVEWATNYYPEPGTQSRSNSVVSRRDSTEWNLPAASSSAFDPFAPIDPFANGGGNRYEAPSYIPHQQSTMMDDWWSQPTQFHPPPAARAPPPAVDPFAFRAFEQPSEIPMNTSNASAEDMEQIEKAERKAARKAKKQEEEDERLARELQNKEFERESSKGESEWIVLTTAQMRDLAEKELGIDNVRIIAGFTVKKYGREGRPHQRKMWVTQSLTHLAWASSLLEGSHRGIELKHVTEVNSGQMTPTIARTTSDKNKVRAQCFSLVTMSRTLDLQACSVIQRDALVAALKAVVAFNHKYKPEKVDRDLTKVKAVGSAASLKDAQ